MFKLTFKKVSPGIAGSISDFRVVLENLETLVAKNHVRIEESYAKVAYEKEQISDARYEISKASKIRKNISALIED